MGDLIDRAALLKEIDALYHGSVDGYEPMSDEEKGIYLCAIEVRDAPAVDAEPVRHGHWRVQKIQGHRKGTVRRLCSACGANNGNRKSNFCPNCGAKMDGERRDHG